MKGVELGLPPVVQRDPEAGRSLVARRDIAAGTVVLTDRPYVSLLHKDLRKQVIHSLPQGP